MTLRSFFTSVVIGVCMVCTQSIEYTYAQSTSQSSASVKSVSDEENNKAVEQKPQTHNDRVDFSFGMHAVVSDTDKPESIAIGKSVLVPSNVKGFLLAVGEDVDIASVVGNGAFVFARNVIIDDVIHKEFFGIGDNIHITRDATIYGDTKLEAHRIVLRGNIEGDVYARAKRVLITGTINGDTYLNAAKIILGKGAKITGKLYYPATSVLKISNKAFVSSCSILEAEEKKTLLEALESLPSQVEHYNYKGAFIGKKGIEFIEHHEKSLSFLHMIIGGLVLFVIGYILFRRFPLFMQKITFQGSFGNSMMRIISHGILGIIGIPIIIICLMITIIGIPVAFLLILAYVLYLFLSKILGIWIISQKIWSQISGIESPTHYSLFAFLLGIIAITLLAMLPIIGWFIGLVVLLLGSGVLWLRLFDKPVIITQKSVALQKDQNKKRVD